MLLTIIGEILKFEIVEGSRRLADPPGTGSMGPFPLRFSCLGKGMIEPHFKKGRPVAADLPMEETEVRSAMLLSTLWL